MEPFFLGVDAGQRFCLFHPPLGQCRAALLYVHPFAEELNKTRRMAALQARALSAQGIGVLQIDLHGCGDSDGDFADARWEGWLRDLAAAGAWLGKRLNQPVGLWGLRLGALLALDYARRATHRLGPLVLWQPAPSGAAALTQFLRLQLAHDMLADGGAAAHDTATMRAALRRGEIVEVAGYRLDGALAGAIDALDIGALAPSVPTLWFDVASAAGRPLAPASARVVDSWRAAGTQVNVHAVAGQPFWSTQETVEVPTLVAATCAALREAGYAN